VYLSTAVFYSPYLASAEGTCVRARVRPRPCDPGPENRWLFCFRDCLPDPVSIPVGFRFWATPGSSRLGDTTNLYTSDRDTLLVQEQYSLGGTLQFICSLLLQAGQGRNVDVHSALLPRYETQQLTQVWPSWMKSSISNCNLTSSAYLACVLIRP
jgi:hypothetical protein